MYRDNVGNYLDNLTVCLQMTEPLVGVVPANSEGSSTGQPELSRTTLKHHSGLLAPNYNPQWGRVNSQVGISTTPNLAGFDSVKNGQVLTLYNPTISLTPQGVQNTTVSSGVVHDPTSDYNIFYTSPEVPFIYIKCRCRFPHRPSVFIILFHSLCCLYILL